MRKRNKHFQFGLFFRNKYLKFALLLYLFLKNKSSIYLRQKLKHNKNIKKEWWSYEMQTKSSYIVVVNGKKFYKKTLEEANKFYERRRGLLPCEIICLNKRVTHKQLNFLEEVSKWKIIN